MVKEEFEIWNQGLIKMVNPEVQTYTLVSSLASPS